MRSALIAAAIGMLPATSFGAPCVRVDAKALAPSLETSMSQQLESAFARRGLGTCAEGEKPIATITLAPSEGASVRISLSVRDEITNKLVERSVDVGGVPDDARGLALAQMADELLRASWAELTIEDAPPPAAPVPVQVREALPAPRKRTLALQLDAQFAVEHFALGWDELGVDVAMRMWPIARLGVALRAGPRGAPSRGVAPGSVSGAGLLVAGGPMVALATTRRFGVGLEGDVGVLWMSLEGHGAGSSRSADGIAVVAMGFASAWLRLGPVFRVALDVGGGGALRGVRVSDGVTDFGGPSGALFAVRGGIGAEL